MALTKDLRQIPAAAGYFVVPSDEEGLRPTFGDLHRRARARRTGHAWQDRFGSVAMDEAQLINALRNVSLDPVRARLVKHAADWRWWSVGS